MADQIRIKNLDVFAYHGVSPEETKLGQKFLVDATLYTDTRAAGFSDDLSKSVDYSAVCYFIAEYMKTHTYKLLESAAEHLAEEILMEVPQLDRINIEIKKPSAPISVPIEMVSVAISRSWHTVDLSLGSNMGDREDYLLSALRGMEANPRVRGIRQSEIIETAPYGNTDQPPFLNAAVEIQTLFTPHEMLAYIHELEDAAGRERGEHWGPRTLDIDILFYDDCVIGEEELTIPHPDMTNRMFVLGPLSELCPSRLHPVFQKSVMRMRRELERRLEKGKNSQ